VAVDGSKVVGVVRGVENHLINLFVDGDYQRQDIATRLVQRFQQVGFTRWLTAARDPQRSAECDKLVVVVGIGIGIEGSLSL